MNLATTISLNASCGSECSCDECQENARIAKWRKRQKTAERPSFKAEIGYAGSSNYPNQIEPMPKGKVPSLKKRKRVLLDEEQERDEEKVMPNAAKRRKQYRLERIGKAGNVQVF